MTNSRPNLLALRGEVRHEATQTSMELAADVVVGRFSFGRMLVSRSPFLAATDESLCLVARAIPRLRRVSEITGLRNVGNADLATAHPTADRGLFGPQQNSSAIRACVIEHESRTTMHEVILGHTQI